MQSRFSARWLVSLLTLLALTDCFAAPQAGTRLRYLVLSASVEAAPPIAAVDFVYGPQEAVGGVGRRRPDAVQWWQLELRTNAALSSTPLCVLRGSTSTDPLAGQSELEFARYQVRIPATGEALEYRDVHAGRALLPAWVGFERRFVPRPAAASQRQGGAPETCEFLGHVLSLHETRSDGPWTAWTDVKRLDLDREVLVGTARNFRDAEGRRLPQSPQSPDYTYTNFIAADYRAMVAAGMNLFTIAPEQEPFVRAEPVFYLRSADGAPALRYPADLYRANYLGAAMFVDEPASILTWDKFVGDTLTHFSDATVLIEQRTRTTFDSPRRHYGRYWLQEQLSSLGINLGGLRLAQTELPVWETFYDCAFYEMKGGGSGIVHEGRYQLKDFDDAVARVTGRRKAHTARQMLQWHYAFLRGGTRPFAKFWGTSIYGQCDPAIAPEALTTAYEMGARYFWFWTSDHGHHVPWPEQLALAQSLSRYAREHPRASIYGPHPKTPVAITIPNGYFVTFADLSWVHGLDKAGKTEQAQNYNRLLRRTVEAVEHCFERGEDFDVTVDDGRPIKEYKRVVKITGR